jgi:hypothetical protein
LSASSSILFSKKLFLNRMEEGTWNKTFELCILRPAFRLAFLLARDSQWYALWKIKGMTFNILAKSSINARFQYACCAPLVRCVKDNSRFMSVSKSVKKYSLTLYNVLTKWCNKSNKKYDVIIKEAETGKNVPIVTNIPLLLSLVIALFIEDHRYVAMPVTQTTKKEDVLEITMDKNPKDYKNEMEKASDSRDDHAKWIKVVNNCRAKLLGITMVTTADYVDGKTYKKESGKANFGLAILQEWEKNEISFFLPGMTDPKTGIPETAKLDELLHMICSVGFFSQLEESKMLASTS